MEKEVVSVEVSKSVGAVLNAVEKLITESKKALADGFQVGADIPAIVAACANDVIAAVGAAGKVSADWKEDQVACEKALALHAVSLKEILAPSQLPPKQ